MLENLLREYNINRIFLSSVGLWPFQNKILKNVLRTFCFLLEISYYSFEAMLLYDHWNDAQMVFEGCYQIVVSTYFLIRIVNEFCNHEKLWKLYRMIDEHWSMFTSDLEVRILKNYSLVSRKFVIYYSISMYACMSGFIIIPLTPIFLDVMLPLNESRPRFLAVKVSEFRLDVDEHFMLIFCYSIAITVIGITVTVGVDAMHIACTTHACSLFALVSQQITNINLRVRDSNEMSEDQAKFESSSEEITYRVYIACLKKHQLAIEFVQTLESTYQWLALIMLMLIIATLSLIAIRIVYVLDQLQEMIRFIFIIMGALMTLIIVCYSSQKLMDESQNVFYRAYATEWYNYSPRLKTLLIIILYRSNVPCGLKAGNMIPLSTATCASVIQMATSYFTAFLSLKN
ncbi:Or9e9 [Eciton burchellii]|nr:Or9e9 [Eciton burchellii]